MIAGFPLRVVLLLFVLVNILGRHYATFRKRENFVCFKALRHRKCFRNAVPGQHFVLANILGNIYGHLYTFS